MAKLSAHGQEVGRIVYLTKTKAYMTDGKVLVNTGCGWKLRGKLKAGLTPETAFNNALQAQAEFIAQRPAFRRYRDCLHDLAGQSKRSILHLTVTMMPDDCDGVWSECCDGYGDNVYASCDEVAQLCSLYRDSVREQNEMKAQQGQQAETV